VLLSLIENIKALTYKADESIKQNKIEQCQIALVERQSLLEKLFEQGSILSVNDQNINNQMIELIQWVQKYDKPNIDDLLSKKQENIKSSLNQVQVKKAMKQYNITR
jgi:hypothetical protein